jgi:regulator of replication initiation timing
MWRQFLAFVQTVFILARDIEQIQARQEKLTEQVHALALAVERLQGQLAALAQREEAAREKLSLQLQLEQKQLAPKSTTKKKR